MALQAVAEDRFGFVFASRLAAAALQAPDVSPFALDAGHAAAVERLRRHPSFRRAIVGARVAAGGDGGVGLEQLDALVRTAPGRLALLVATEPDDAVRTAALIAAAAVLQKRVLRIAAKADRQRVRDAFGVEPFQIATQEAPTLHPSLANLDRNDAAWHRVLEGGAAGAQAVEDVGKAALVSFAERVEPRLAIAVERRLPDRADAARLPFPDAEISQFVRLLRRRMTSWSAIIA